MVAEMHRILTTDLPMIEQVSAHLLRRRGKFFRPTLALLACSADAAPAAADEAPAAGGIAMAISIAAVVELMHIASLVHDDSVDHSVLRRGLPTVNSLFSHQVSVIMGDFLYSRALTALVALRNLEMVRILTEVSNQLTIGEMRQLAAVDALSFSEAEYYELIHAKTASLISGACETGSLCGSGTHRRELAAYGRDLGTAFQIMDDILDYTEDQAVTGKPSGSDLREHKVTLPLIAALSGGAASRTGRARVEQLFATETPDDPLISDVVQIVTEAGGIEYARRRGEEFASRALETLGVIPESDARTALGRAVAYVMERHS